jgi:tripartite-type tricarboxylate transporter receptor subunit TctC
MKKLLAILALVPALAFAWEPTKPITVTVGNAPGAGNEIAFRQLAAIVQKANPQVNFVIENRPGADSVVSQNYMLTQPADGYHASIPSHMSTYVTNDIWEKSIKKFEYNTFTDVMTIGKSPLVLVAKSDSRVNTPQEFVRLIQTTKAPVNVAIGGGAHRMAFEYLMVKNNGLRDQVKIIKFNGPLQAVTSVAADAGTEFGIMPIAIARPLVEAGKVKPIGFTGTRTVPQFPRVPLLRDVAPGISVYAAWTLSLPPNAPADVVDWYTRTFTAAIRSPEYKKWMEENLVFVEESELKPEGLRKHMDELRTTFMPMAKYITE